MKISPPKTVDQIESEFAKDIVNRYFRRANGTIKWWEVAEMFNIPHNARHRGAEPPVFGANLPEGFFDDEEDIA